MTLPASLVQVPVHGKITDVSTGAAGVGYVNFRIPQAIVDTIDKVVLGNGNGNFRATLDAAGEFTISLPACDTPGFTPSGWAYEMRVFTDIWRVEKLLVQVPSATSGTLELASLILSGPQPAPLPGYLPLSGGTLTGPLVLGADPTIPLGAATKNYVDTHGAGGTTTVTSVAGKSGAVSLVVADVAGAVPATRQVVSGTGLAGGGPLTADLTLSVTYGTAAGTAAAGNDSRLSDARTPVAHAASHGIGGSDPITPASIGALSTAYVPPVISVAGKGGAVTLVPADAGADPAGSATSAVTAHTAAADPHGDRAFAIQRANHTGSQLAATISDLATAVAGTALLKASNLSDLANTTTARTNLGLGGAAVLGVGTAPGTVAAGNDSRILGSLQSSLVTAKGDLLAATAAGTVSRVGVGSDGQALVADSTQAAGVKWAGQSGGPGPAYPLSAYNFLAASGHPENFMAVGAPGTNQLWLVRIYVPAGAAITNIWAGIRSAGTYAATAVPTQAALFSDSGVQVAATANDTTMWSATGWRGGALVGGPVAAQGVSRFVYGALLFGGYSNVNYGCLSSAGDANTPWFDVGPGVTNRRCMYNTVSTMPTSFDPTTYGTVTTFLPIVGLN